MGPRRSSFRAALASAAAARALLLALGLATSALLARLLPPEALGGWYLLAQIAALGALLAGWGTGTSLQRFVAVAVEADRPAAARRTALAGLGLVSLGAVAAGSALALGWRPLVDGALGAPSLRPLLPAAAGLVAAGALEQLASAALRAAGRTRAGLAVLGLPREGLFVVACAALLATRGAAGLQLLAAVRLAAAGVGATLGVVLLLRALPAGAVGPEDGAVGLRSLAATSSPMLAHLVGAHLLAAADVWFVGLALDERSVAVYASMARLVVLVGAALPIVQLVLPPRLAALHAGGRHAEAELLLRRSATLGAVGAVGALVVLAVLGRPLVRLVFGPGFEAGVPVLLLLAAGRAFHACCGSPGWLLQMTGHHRLLTRITMLSLAANLLLNAAGVALLGAVGVAAATSAALVLQNLATTAAARRVLGIRTHAYWNPAAAWRAA